MRASCFRKPLRKKCSTQHVLLPCLLRVLPVWSSWSTFLVRMRWADKLYRIHNYVFLSLLFFFELYYFQKTPFLKRVHPYVFFRPFSSLALFLQTLFLLSPENSSFQIFPFLPLYSAYSREFVIAHFPSLPFLELCCCKSSFLFLKCFSIPFLLLPPTPIHPHPSRPSLRILYPFSSFRFYSHLCLSRQIIMIFSHPLSFFSFVFQIIVPGSSGKWHTFKRRPHLSPRPAAWVFWFCRRPRKEYAYFPFNSTTMPNFLFSISSWN